MYGLALDKSFASYLEPKVTWLKKTKASPQRGFENDSISVPEAERRTAEQKVATLALMLGQIANYCPTISRNSIIRNSTSLCRYMAAH